MFYGVNIKSSSHLILGRNIHISSGTYIRVDDNSSLEIGDNFWCNNNCFLRSEAQLRIGNDVLVGWNVVFNTTDGHTLYENDIPKENSGNISVGNHVWIASFSTILKNVEIANDCVVSQHSLVNKSCVNEHSLLAGSPAKAIKSHISWEK